MKNVWAFCALEENIDLALYVSFSTFQYIARITESFQCMMLLQKGGL